MIVSINQPAYLPWLGYFHRIAISDVHIVLDHVQFEKNSFGNRNKVRTANGWTWLTVPLKTSGRFGALELNAVEIAEGQAWAKKHWQTIRQSYARAPYFAEYGKELESFYQREWARLIDLVGATTQYQLQALEIATPLLYSSQLPTGGSKGELVLNLCKEVGARVYLSGPLGRDYLDLDRFRAESIEVRFHDYAHPTYPQVQGSFEPYMSALDLLFNCGPRSLDVLNGRDGLTAAA